MTKKQKTCKVCKNKIVELKDTKGGIVYAHKKKLHWTQAPHKAVPMEDTEEVQTPSSQAQDNNAT